MTTAVTSPFRFFPLHVVRTMRLSPSLVRVTFGGAELDAFACGGRDQSVSLFLPHPGQPEPVVPVEEGDGWWRAWRQLPDGVRAVMRSYTVRGQRHNPDGSSEIDIDFALHGRPDAPGATHTTATVLREAVPAGPASRWAARASPGDRALVLGPAVADNSAVRFRPPADTDLVVLCADETALPAVAGILESLPPGLRVRAWCEVPCDADRQDLSTRADAHITWLVRETGAPRLDTTLRDAQLPATAAPYAWVAGESSQVKSVRRHLVGERGFDRGRVTFVGYWRRGLSEEQLRAEAEAARAAAA
ncbi:siderophore-interacting protein [Streptomyces odontomachi]|uniref:siderophore-interacting protein n=1 Tax=Streptomyces odontomachi TaxID=2944940 RepID=UPI00210A0896|nr:siderophore-interacting protein [Streptomyces sp. ODS25]